MIPIDDIRHAAARIKGRLHRTPLLSASSLGDRVGVRLHLKAESLQKTGSFKPRGALNKVLSLLESERPTGLVTVSAGNHAQAVAWAAKSAGVPCVVVMPQSAPAAKLEAVRGYGARIVLHADNATLFDRLREVEAETGFAFVHPFDDPIVLAGAGTVGLEILEDLPEVDAVFVAVGGGGLMAGLASAVKQLRPATRVIAVELAAGPGLAPAIAAGKPVPVARPVGTLADGLIPPFVGSIPLEIARTAVDDIVAVTEAEIANAMVQLATRARLVAEGGGAAAVAALLARRPGLAPGSRVVAIVSGGNVDPGRLARVLSESSAAGPQ